jgi:hypothetical protein
MNHDSGQTDIKNIRAAHLCPSSLLQKETVRKVRIRLPMKLKPRRGIRPCPIGRAYKINYSRYIPKTRSPFQKRAKSIAKSRHGCVLSWTDKIIKHRKVIICLPAVQRSKLPEAICHVKPTLDNQTHKRPLSTTHIKPTRQHQKYL